MSGCGGQVRRTSRWLEFCHLLHLHHPERAETLNLSGPEPGADTEAVMEEMLQMGAEKVADLEAAGVLGFKPINGTALANWTAKL